MDVDELIENFEMFEDWSDRYQYLIELGRKMPALPDAARSEPNRVTGCMSQVWLEFDDAAPQLAFVGDSDSAIVRGLIAVLRVIYVGRPRGEVAVVDLEGIFAQLGLAEHLSPNRRNGFFSMVERIRGRA